MWLLGCALVVDSTRIVAGDVKGGLHIVAQAETEEDGLQWQLVATCKVTRSTRDTLSHWNIVRD